MSAPAVIIRGSLSPYLQASTFDYDPTRGWLYHYDYKGASQTLMAALQATYVASGIACRLTYHQGDTASLDVQDSTQQTAIDRWEMLGNEESRDGLSHPLLTAILSDEEIGQVRAGIQNIDSSSTTPISDITDAIVGLAGADLATTEAFIGLQLRGSTDYQRGQYVLRHTTNAPNRYAVNVADLGVDKVYTTALLLTEVQDSSSWVYPLPARVAYKISSIPVPSAQTNYLWGWKKSVSTECNAPYNRIDIVTEYVLEQWSIQDNGYYRVY